MLNSVILLVAVFLSSWSTYQLCKKFQQPLTEQSNGLLDDLRKQNQELLNRIQAEDIRTFKSLQHSTKLESPNDFVYIPRSDEAEAIQAQTLYGEFGEQTWGLGETLVNTDEEFQQTMKEMGLDMWEPDV